MQERTVHFKIVLFPYIIHASFFHFFLLLHLLSNFPLVSSSEFLRHFSQPFPQCLPIFISWSLPYFSLLLLEFFLAKNHLLCVLFNENAMKNVRSPMGQLLLLLFFAMFRLSELIFYFVKHASAHRIAAFPITPTPLGWDKKKARVYMDYINYLTLYRNSNNKKFIISLTRKS